MGRQCYKTHLRDFPRFYLRGLLQLSGVSADSAGIVAGKLPIAIVARRVYYSLLVRSASV